MSHLHLAKDWVFLKKKEGQQFLSAWFNTLNLCAKYSYNISLLKD